MGWDATLQDENGVVYIPRQNEGSTLCISKNGLEGTTHASMLVTYNYSELYHLAINQSLPDFLHGKYAKDTIPILKKCVEKLGTKQYKRQRDDMQGLENMSNPKAWIYDYWTPTMGNAGYIASVLLDWAQLHPNAKWEISK